MGNMIKTAAWIFVIFGLFSGGYILGSLSTPAPAPVEQPYCPTEDSCRPQYRDGAWTIVEVTP